jgi:hypothetical protein
VALYAPRSRGTLAYFELAGEFSARNGLEIPRKAEQEATESVEAETEVHFGPGS